MSSRNLFVLCAAVLVFFAGVGKPIYNWDMIPYIASAYYADGYRGADLSSRTYGALKSEVDAETYTFLTSGNYTSTVYQDPVSLEQQLPLYSIRVAYIGLMRALHAVGIDYPKATYLISAVFAALSVLMMAALYSAAGLPWVTYPVVLIGAGFSLQSSLSTPDAFACFFSLWAMYCLLTSSRLLFLLCAILPWFRTDGIVLCAMLMGVTFWRGQRVLSTVSFLCAFAAYVFINRTHGNYGWLTLFNFSFIKITPYPATMTLSHDPARYVLAYWRTFRDLIAEPSAHTVIYVLCIFVLVMVRGAVRRLRAPHVFLTIPAAYVILRLALFPEYEDRFFVFPAGLILAGTLAILHSLMRDESHPDHPDLQRAG